MSAFEVSFKIHAAIPPSRVWDDLSTAKTGDFLSLLCYHPRRTAGAVPLSVDLPVAFVCSLSVTEIPSFAEIPSVSRTVGLVV